jgi:hypothetical protein
MAVAGRYAAWIHRGGRKIFWQILTDDDLAKEHPDELAIPGFPVLGEIEYILLNNEGYLFARIHLPAAGVGRRYVLIPESQYFGR